MAKAKRVNSVKDKEAETEDKYEGSYQIGILRLLDALKSKPVVTKTRHK